MNKISGNHIVVIRKIMLALPGVSEGLCFGTAAFYVQKKLLARMKEDGLILVVHTPDRDVWTDKDPLTFFITGHYKNYPSVLVNLTRIKKKELTQILTEAWKSRAGKKLLMQLKDEDLKSS